MTLPESRQRNQRYSLRGARYRGLSSVPSTPSFRANSVRGSPTAARGWLLTGMLPICAANVLRLSQFGMSSGLSALLRRGAQYEISCQHGSEQQVWIWDVLRQSFQFRGNQCYPLQSPVGKHCLHRPRVLAVGLRALGGGNQHLKGIGFLLRCVQNTTQ